MLEITTENGQQSKNEIRKIFHATLLPQDNGQFILHLEAFDRLHRNRDLSTTEKNFLDHVAAINDNIIIRIDGNANVLELLNFDDIMQKARQKIVRLSQSYTGNEAKKTFEFLDHFYNNKSLICEDIKRYNQYGLLLSSQYGQYQSHHPLVRQLRYNNILENMLIEIEEAFFVKQIDEKNDEIIVDISGKIHSTMPCEMIFTNLYHKGINYSKATDRPALNRYGGVLLFHHTSRQVKKAEINVEFSCGPNYVKNILYSLTEISHDEI